METRGIRRENRCLYYDQLLFPAKKLSTPLQKKVNVVSLDELLNKKTTLAELIPDKIPLFDEKIDDALFIQQMKDKELTRREKEVIKFLPQNYTIRQIGEKLGISHVRVLKIKENILKKFKKGGLPKRINFYFYKYISKLWYIFRKFKFST